MKNNKLGIMQARLAKKKETEKKAIAELREKKDQIRNTLGRMIIVCGRKHIIVPAIERPDNLHANYMGQYGWALSKIEK